MRTMKIGSLARPFSHGAVRSIPIVSDDLLDDFDIVIWDPLPMFTGVFNVEFSYKNYSGTVFRQLCT